MISQLLLQTSPLVMQEADSRIIYTTIAVFVTFILVLVIGNLLANRKKTISTEGYLTTKWGSAGSVKTAPKISKRKFKKNAKQIGLSQEQIKMLEDIADNYNIASPAVLLTSHKAFDVTMKRVIQDYDSGEYPTEVKEHYKMLLFDIKQKIDKTSSVNEKISSSRQLITGKQITVTAPSGEKCSTNIVTNLREYICASIPKRQDGSALRLNKWDPVKISVRVKGDKGIFYDSKVVGYSTAKGTPCIMLQHSNNIKSSKQRNFPRKELGKSCYFFRINVVTLKEGKATVKKAVIDDNSKGRLGNVIEISAGGCSIKSQSFLNKGELLRIDLDIERRQTISMLGKIVNLRKLAPGLATMHIQFTRMSKKNMNSINSYIYGIGEKTSILDY